MLDAFFAMRTDWRPPNTNYTGVILASMENFWSTCLGRFQEELSSQQYNTWIKPLQCEVIDDGLRLFAPNRFVQQWVKDRAIICSFNLDYALKLKQRRPDLAVGGIVSTAGRMFEKDLSALDLISMHPKVFSLETLIECRRNLQLVSLWTLDSAKELHTYRKFEIDAFITNAPERFAIRRP